MNYNSIKTELSDDLISRNAVLKEISCWIGSGEYRYAMSERFLIDRIKTLSSVNPQEPKTGHWIDSSNGWMCSECHRDNTYDTDFCPNCGCRMVEPQESEVEE